jgi:hypothetical protein
VPLAVPLGLHMPLSFSTVAFRDASLGIHGKRTSDGRQFGIRVDRLSTSLPRDAQVQTGSRSARAHGVIKCSGDGWASVTIHGVTRCSGGRCIAQLIGDVNGRPIAAVARAGTEPLLATVAVPVHNDGELRLALVLIAEPDPDEPGSEASCSVQRIELCVLDAAHPTASRSFQ